MKKLLCTLIAAVFLCAALSVTASAAFAPVGDFEIPYTATPPTIDGELKTGEWSDASVLTMTKDNSLSWVGSVPDGTPVKLYMYWGDEGLYVAGEVVDPTFKFNTNPAKYTGDSFQISLNMGNVFTSAEANDRAIFYSWSLCEDGTFRIIRDAGETPGSNVLPTTGMGKKTEAGWQFEYLLPWYNALEDTYWKSAEILEVKPGLELGMLVCYIDYPLEGGVSNAYGTPSTETMSWSPAHHGVKAKLVDKNDLFVAPEIPIYTEEGWTPPETDPVTEPETDPVTEPETDPVTEPETDPVTEPETDPQTEPETDPQAPSDDGKDDAGKNEGGCSCGGTGAGLALLLVADIAFITFKKKKFF